MQTWNPVEEEFIVHGIVRGGVLVFPPEIALQVVRRAKERRVPVLGLDAFILTPGSLQPFMEHSINLSDTPKDVSWAVAERFLVQYLTSAFHFEIVLAS